MDIKNNSKLESVYGMLSRIGYGLKHPQDLNGLPEHKAVMERLMEHQKAEEEATKLEKHKKAKDETLKLEEQQKAKEEASKLEEQQKAKEEASKHE